MDTHLAALQRTIARLEGRAVGDFPRPQQGAGRMNDKNKTRTNGLASGVADLDTAFRATGLAGDALHEMHAAEARIAGAATGFLLALLVRLASREPDRHAPLLWVQDAAGAHETGRLYAPGLHAFGCDPRGVIVVSGRSVTETLWAMEEGLSCRGLAAVVGEIRGTPKALDLTATRRLALRAEKAKKPVFLLRIGAGEAPSAARSRWRIVPVRSAALDGYAAGLGRAAWHVELSKNRDGPTGAWTLEWNHHDQCLLLAAPDPVAHPAAPGDRPARPRRLGTVVALERAS